MKHLLNGVAIAAALAIAAPAWAQAPMTPAKSAPTAAAPAAGAPMAKMTQRHKRGMKKMAAKRGGAMSMTDQLNREELARIQAGGAPMAPAGGVPGQPSQQRGIPGAGQPSASYHPVPQ